MDPLVAKYDLNHNGKIDVSERKPYVRELSRQRREEAKAFAAQQPVLTPQERQFFHPPQLTPELIQKSDTNHDGKLETTERLKIMQDAAEAARQEFRRYDVNQDGKLDKEEMKAVHQAQQAEREQRVSRARQCGTNSVLSLPPK
jgi:Ca2+-binding EF-hand superfamily protein